MDQLTTIDTLTKPAVLSKDTKAFAETPRDKADREAALVMFYDATIDVNFKRMETKQNMGTVAKEDLSFFALDTFQNMVAAEKGIKLPDYGDIQTDRNKLSIQLYSDLFTQINPKLESQVREALVDNPRYSYSAILSYVMVKDEQSSFKLSDIPEYYREGIMESKMCAQHKLKTPDHQQIENSRRKYLDGLQTPPATEN